jgi:drug/metabolite transporter (DMT)-like permease
MNSRITATSTGSLRESGASRPPFSLVIAAFAAVYLIWGSTYLGMRLAIDSIPPLLMAGTRFIIAGGLLYGIMRMLGAARPDFGHWRSSTITGALLLMGGNGAVVWAQQTVPTGLAALVMASVPLWIMLVDWLRPQGVRPTGRILLGLIVGMAGVFVIVLGRGALGQRMIEPVAATVLVLGNIAWACGSIYARYARKPSSALLSVAMQMFCGGVLQFLLGLCLGEARGFQFSAITATSAWAFVYLTFIGSLVGYTAYIWLLQVSTPARVSTHAYVNPFVAVLLGWWVLNEAIPQSVIIAGALILFSVVLITRSSRSPE